MAYNRGPFGTNVAALPGLVGIAFTLGTINLPNDRIAARGPGPLGPPCSLWPSISRAAPCLIFCSIRSAHRRFRRRRTATSTPLPSGATNGAIHRCHWKSGWFDLLTLHALEGTRLWEAAAIPPRPKTSAEVGAGFQSVCFRRFAQRRPAQTALCTALSANTYHGDTLPSELRGRRKSASDLDFR
jgi:hypothetical protein